MELLVQRVEQQQTSKRIALWRVTEHRARSSASSVLSHEDSMVAVTFAALFQWINAVRDAVQPIPSEEPLSSSASPALSPSSSPFLVVGIALPLCSIEGSALVLTVAREKRWVYVPIDVTLPLSQQVFLLQDAHVNTLVTFPESAIAHFLTKNASDLLYDLPRVVESDGAFGSLSVFSLATSAPEPQPWILADDSTADPLYILYTSGSTGEPKGVIGSRSGALNRLQWMWEQFPFDGRSSETRSKEERVVRVTKLTFVDSVWEILGAVLKQVPLVHLVQQRSQPEVHQNSRSDAFPAAHAILDQTELFLQVVERSQVSRFTVVPSVLEVLLLKHSSTMTMLQKALASVQYILVSGEVLPLSLVVQVTQLLPHIKLLNLYGSTEVSGDITWLEIQAPLSEKDLALWTEHGVPIGRIQNRIGNTRLRLCNPVNGSSEEYAQLQPGTLSKFAESSSREQVLGGELYAAGHALALGYTREDTPVVDDGNEAVKKWVSFEDEEKSATWFRTGDICKVLGDFIFFCGRDDSLVKIRGQRIQLEAVERIVESALSKIMESPQRASILHVVVLATTDPSSYGLSSQSLVAFLLTQASQNEPRDPSKSQASTTSLPPMSVQCPQKASLFKWIKDEFGDAYVPRDAVLVPADSVNRLSSGKLDRSALRALYESEVQTAREVGERRVNIASQGERLGPSISRARRFLKAQVSKVLGIASFADFSNVSMWSRTFQEIGGNSLHAALLSWEAQQELGCVIQPQEWLASSFEEIVKSLEQHLAQPSDSTDSGSVALEQNRYVDAAVEDQHTITRPTKRPRHSTYRKHAEADTLRSKTNMWALSRLNRTSHGSTFIPQLTPCSSAFKTFKLEVEWKFDLGKCIDASPLVIRHSESTWVVIGSHSAELACLDVKNHGEIIWKRKLDDRIEASASMSERNRTVYVGTYSGALYAMDALNGDVKWLFRANDAIKAAVLVIDAFQLVVCGAYDHFVYGIDSVTGEKQWKLGTADGGSVFSTPVFASATSRLFFATTKGSVCCIALSDGGDNNRITTPRVCWTRQLPAPVFSSLSITPELNLLFVGCADGNMYALNTVDGGIRWLVETCKPIFSSPCIYRDIRNQSTTKKSCMVFGSHDGVLRKVSCENGHLLWETTLGGPVFSSPVVFQVASASTSASADSDEPGGEPKMRMMCCVATTDGTLFVCDESSGAIVTQLSSLTIKEPETDSDGPSEDTEKYHQLVALGELFSSPVVIADLCLIGSRSNQLYAFRVAVE